MTAKREMLDNKVIQDGVFKGNYMNWLKMQFTGLDRFAWLLYGIGLGFQFSIFLANPITGLSIIAFIAIAFGFLCTVMMASKGWVKTKESNGTITEHLVSGRSVNGLLGAISVVGYIYVNIQAGHFFSAFDQVIFFLAIDLAMILKWRTWGNGKDEATKNPTVKTWLIIIASILIGWAILYPIGVVLGDSQPVVDALVLSFGATASVLYVKRNSASYLVFITSNVTNIILWGGALKGELSPASLAMLAMTLMYMISSMYGFYNMRFVKQGQTRELRKEESEILN